jgi:hypothetical protein
MTFLALGGVRAAVFAAGLDVFVISRGAGIPSRHQQDEQTTGDYKSSTEHDSVIRNLLEENKGNDLGDNEEDRDIDPHQAIEIEAAFVDQETIHQQGHPPATMKYLVPSNPIRIRASPPISRNAASTRMMKAFRIKCLLRTIAAALRR